MTSGIYCIENVENGKQYIGKGKNVEKRMWDSHKENIVINRTIKKYGKEILIRYIVEYCEIDSLDELEQFYIEEWNTKSPNGYNLTDGGGGVSNPPLETREKMRNSQLGKKRSPESVLKSANGNRGQLRSVSSRENMSNARIGFKYENSKSKYYGVAPVVFLNKYSYWMVRVSYELKKRKTIGYFKTEIDAAFAYDKFIKDNKLLNPLNFPDL